MPFSEGRLQSEKILRAFLTEFYNTENRAYSVLTVPLMEKIYRTQKSSQQVVFGLTMNREDSKIIKFDEQLL